MKVCCLGEDLVPESPLQAEAAGQGEGNDRYTHDSLFVASYILILTITEPSSPGQARRVAVPVLVKDGKPCPSSDPLDPDQSGETRIIKMTLKTFC